MRSKINLFCVVKLTVTRGVKIFKTTRAPPIRGDGPCSFFFSRHLKSENVSIFILLNFRGKNRRLRSENELELLITG